MEFRRLAALTDQITGDPAEIGAAARGLEIVRVSVHSRPWLGLGWRDGPDRSAAKRSWGLILTQRLDSHSGDAPAATWKTEASREAAAWVLRLRAPECGEADWTAFETWLLQAPDSREAFDEAMVLWLAMDEPANDALAPLRRRAHMARGRGRLAALGGAMAAAVALAIAIAPGLLGAPGSPMVFATAKGERKTVELADGTRLDLGGGSRVLVRMTRGRREVTMTRGEVAFTVVHNAHRPFVVTVGDRAVEDLGTEFDIRRRGGDLAVTVRRGMVEVEPSAGARGQAVSVGVGQQLRHFTGAADSTLERVSADDVFAWRQGRLVYRGEPLQRVVDDLNEYFPGAIRLEGPDLAGLRFTGVIKVDSEAATLRRLATLAPISETVDGGVFVLRSRQSGR